MAQKKITIERASGDETPVKIVWGGDVDFTAVTAISLAIYSDAAATTLVETLTGEIRGFDPATFFPILTPSWTGTRYWRITVTRTAEDQVFPTINEWTQT